jgi:phosphate uptake regulator
MAITSVDSALAQYNANLDWNVNPANAQAALEAIRYLIVNQPMSMSVAGRTITKNLVQLEKEAANLAIEIGIGPRSRGRTSFVGTRFADPAGRCR